MTFKDATLAEGPAKYAPSSEAPVHDLVRDHSLAWVVGSDGGFTATPLPLLPLLGADGALIGFEGHLARSNPQLEALRRSPRALILFMGLNAYVSPSWMEDRTQAPTWNYETAAFECEVTLMEEADAAGEHLGRLVERHEAGRPAAWSIEEMGRRYVGLSRGVVAFHATILARRVAFKLGQDERTDVWPDIVRGFEATGQGDMAARMRDAAGVMPSG